MDDTVVSMSPQESRERAIVSKAVGMASLGERDAFLHGVCAGDERRRARLEALLADEQGPGSGNDGLTAQPESREASTREPDESDRTEAPGTVVGRYRILQRLGEGGFGVVYMAEQREPVKRRVALKIIKLGMDTRQVVARFEAERQALAMMDHPNIAKVLDGGSTRTGRPYFVMELVRGISFLEFCDLYRLSLPERLHLFSQVCQAVHHAHQKGIIHRDIKPSNVLVTMLDDRAVPKVIDFGVAKATRHELTEKTVFTRHQEFIGTPAYMSPEQAQFSGWDIDTRTDIYSLGVLLYELIVGRTPFESKDLLRGGYDGMRQMIREQEPLKPSARLKTLEEDDLRPIAAFRGVEPSRLPSLIRGDLDWIVMKALEKDRSRRYDSAFALTEDVMQFLNNRPVSAAPPRMGYRFRRFARRHRATLAASLVIAICLIAGSVISGVMAVRALSAERRMREALTHELAARRTAQEAVSAAQEAERRAQDEATIAASVNRFLNDEFLGLADPMKEPDRDIRLRTLLDGASQRLESHFTGHPLVEASIRQTMGQVYLNLADYEAADRHARRAVQLRAAHLGEEQLATLQARVLRAAVGYRQGHYEAIEPELKRLWESARAQTGPESELTLEIVYWLAQSYSQSSKDDIAWQMVREAREAAHRALSRDHPLRAAIELAEGRFFLSTNRFAEGEAYCRQWLQGTGQELGEEHPYTLHMRHYLAFACEWQGQTSEAEKIYRQAAEVKARVLGPEHPGTLGTREALAMLLSREKRLDEAEAILLEVLDVRRRKLGETHPDTRATVRSLFGVYVTADKSDANKAFLREVLRRDPENPHALEGLAQFLDSRRLTLLAPDSEAGASSWRYTLDEPEGDWTAPDYDDAGWETGKAPFGNATAIAMATPWETRSIWLRRTVDLEERPNGRLVISLLQDDGTKVYINGVLAMERSGWTGRTFRLVFAGKKANERLEPGRNVIAVRCQNVRDEGVFDAGLYLEPAEDSLFSEPSGSTDHATAQAGE